MLQCPACTYANRKTDKICGMCDMNLSALSVEEFLRKITAMVTANNELIEQINAQKGSVNLITYVITRQADGKHVVTEQTTTSPAQTVVAQWEVSTELTKIPDVFNDRLNFQCANFQDLVRLNRDMAEIAYRFKFLRDEPAIVELNKFLSNYCLIQMALKQLFQLINTGGRGHLADIQRQLQSINSCVAELQKYKNLRFA
jgi:hypothetical protein